MSSDDKLKADAEKAAEKWRGAKVDPFNKRFLVDEILAVAQAHAAEVSKLKLSRCTWCGEEGDINKDAIWDHVKSCEASPVVKLRAERDRLTAENNRLNINMNGWSLQNESLRQQLDEARGHITEGDAEIRRLTAEVDRMKAVNADHAAKWLAAKEQLAERDAEIEQYDRETASQPISAPSPTLDEVIAALRAVMPYENSGGHAHERPGFWDSDNGARANTPCEKCRHWTAARELLARLDAAPSPAPGDNGPPGVCYNPPTPEVADTLHRTQSTPTPGARIPFGPKCTYAMCVCGKGCGRLVESAPSEPERCNATWDNSKLVRRCCLPQPHAMHRSWRAGDESQVQWWEDTSPGAKPHTPAETAKEPDRIKWEQPSAEHWEELRKRQAEAAAREQTAKEPGVIPGDGRKCCHQMQGQIDQLRQQSIESHRWQGIAERERDAAREEAEQAQKELMALRKRLRNLGGAT
jgi:hypothetical protein